jgi:hypothetical protein
MINFEFLRSPVHPLIRDRCLFVIDVIIHATYIQTTHGRQLFPKNQKYLLEQIHKRVIAYSDSLSDADHVSFEKQPNKESNR